jgi:uncharacterized phiE125 gp8 family phage protein
VSFTTSAGLVALAPETYVARISARDAAIAPAPNTVWPMLTPPLGGVRIDYTSGFGAAAEDMPGPLKQAILALVAYAYDHRGDPGAAPLALVEPWLAPYRRMRL